MNNTQIIAVDGLSACGKSTLAQQLAKKLNYIYIDTGAMYRAITLYIIEHNIDVTNIQQIESQLKNINLTFKNIESKQHIFLNNVDVSDAIREMHVSKKVSIISAISAVRKFAVQLQRNIGNSSNVVMDGRDIGTVVFPNAAIKIFMTADKDIRIERRFNELSLKNKSITREEVKKNIEDRDYMDVHRKDSPLKRASDALILDNSVLSIHEQLEIALNYIKNPTEKSQVVGINRFFMIMVHLLVAGSFAFFFSMTANAFINLYVKEKVDTVGISLLVCVFHCIVSCILFILSLIKPKIPLIRAFKYTLLLPIVLIVGWYVFKALWGGNKIMVGLNQVSFYYVLLLYIITAGLSYYFIYRVLGSSKTI